jgi:hypothetical protein
VAVCDAKACGDHNEQRGHEPAANNVPWIKNAFYWDFHSPTMIKTHIKNVRGLTRIDQTFASATFHRFLL